MVNRNRLLAALPDWNLGLSAQRLVRYGIIGAVFGISLLLAVLGSQRLMLFVLLLIVALLGALTLLRKLPLGLLAIIFTAFLAPSLVSSGTLSGLTPPLILVGVMLGLWVVDMVARKRKIRFVRSRTLLPAVVFLVITLISFLNGQINYFRFTQVAPLFAQIGELAILMLSIGAFFVVAHLVEEIKWVERMTWLFIDLGAIYIFARLIPITDHYIRPLFQYGSDASLFWVWLVALTSSQLFLNRQLSKRARNFLVVLLGATLYISLVPDYQWKSGWLPSLVALSLVSWFAFPRYRIAGVVVAALVAMASFFFIGRVATGGEDYSILTRVEAWRIILEIVKVNPLLGLGLSNYYWYTSLFPILGYSVNFNSHNNYIDILAQMGLIGLACFLWLAWEVGRLGWELHSIVPEGFPKAYVIGALAGLVGTLASGMLGDWILPFVYNVGLHGFRSSVMAWLFLGGLVALEQIYRNPQSSSAVE